MIATNVTSFRKNIFAMLEQTIKYNEPLSVSTKSGSVVVLSEEDYRGLTESLYLSSVPGMKEKLIDGKNTPLNDCVPESEIEW
jgi:PHD/YefM family antitoxin component YafN of YafNO toxin-antitoxin module